MRLTETKNLAEHTAHVQAKSNNTRYTVSFKKKGTMTLLVDFFFSIYLRIFGKFLHTVQCQILKCSQKYSKRIKRNLNIPNKNEKFLVSSLEQ